MQHIYSFKVNTNKLTKTLNFKHLEIFFKNINLENEKTQLFLILSKLTLILIRQNEPRKIVLTNTVVKPNKTKGNEQQITYESLKYDQGKLNHLQVHESEYQESNKLKKYGSTSTISTISSVGSTGSTHTVLFANSINSYKTVDTTFDETTYGNTKSEANESNAKNKLDLKKINQQTIIINKNKLQQANERLEEARAITDKVHTLKF